MIKTIEVDSSIKSVTASILSQGALSLKNASLTLRTAPKTISEKQNETTNTPLNIRLEGASTTTSSGDAVRTSKTEADRFRKGLEDCLDNDFFEPGTKSAADHYVERWLSLRPLMTQVETGKVFLASRGNDRRLIGILNLITHMDMKTFHPMNEMIALSALSHRSTEIKECAVRAFEYWEDVDLIRSLTHHTLTPKWLDDYRLEVISDFCGI
ncbi:hypothetical protein [Pseudomonas sp. IT-P260]|uniref:hypothetical protein n=1 Tax=Pseudomonas sp. IT-P260 TaxID=3026457 RepID=UPI0039E0BA29